MTENKRLFGTAKGHREHIVDCTGRLYSDSEVADLLDNYEKENEGLNAKNKVLYKEIERLKRQNEAILYNNAKNMELLEKENEQLKSQIEHLKVKIDRERNATTKQHLKWDKEVQKQLTEQGTQIDFLKNENRHMRTVLQENKELKDLLKSMADRNNEIWLDNGQIIRLKKIFKGEWIND